MQFHIVHTTAFDYPAPATEAFSEVRLRPRDTPHQSVSHHQIRVSPAVLTDDYTDYFGNHVETMSVPFRHQRLAVTSTCDVFTHPRPDPLGNLTLTVCEARLLYRTQRRFLHDFSRPSHYVAFTPQVDALSRLLLPETGDFTRCVTEASRYVYENFTYTPGVTTVNSGLTELFETKAGVCQDFAHLLIGICRMAGIPARYVSGYIETDPAPEGALVGATASHAWVEVMAPNGFWVGLDPTNNIFEGERHVQIGIGRDYRDVPPMKGTFKGPNQQTLSVNVRMTRGRIGSAGGTLTDAATMEETAEDE